ncbi:hypothetical protein [Limnobacter sp.]|uniref:hypothetical protein n=1 Tax=Limnobacter sp. TaxID=2003368 RepID=UPI002FE26B99
MKKSKDEFLKELELTGFSEVVTVTREGSTGLGDHHHPFEAKALISESYGPQGVVYLVGRKG